MYVCTYLIVASSAAEANTDTFGSSDARKSAVHLEELMRRLDSGNIQLIDVREPHEIEETGSIATSINIPSIVTAFFVFIA